MLTSARELYRFRGDNPDGRLCPQAVSPHLYRARLLYRARRSFYPVSKSATGALSGQGAWSRRTCHHTVLWLETPPGLSKRTLRPGRMRITAKFLPLQGRDVCLLSRDCCLFAPDPAKNITTLDCVLKIIPPEINLAHHPAELPTTFKLEDIMRENYRHVELHPPPAPFCHH